MSATRAGHCIVGQGKAWGSSHTVPVSRSYLQKNKWAHSKTQRKSSFTRASTQTLHLPMRLRPSYSLYSFY